MKTPIDHYCALVLSGHLWWKYLTTKNLYVSSYWGYLGIIHDVITFSPQLLKWSLFHQVYLLTKKGGFLFQNDAKLCNPRCKIHTSMSPGEFWHACKWKCYTTIFLIQDSFTGLFLLLTLTIAHFLNFSLPKAHLILAF